VRASKIENAKSEKKKTVLERVRPEILRFCRHYYRDIQGGIRRHRS